MFRFFLVSLRFLKSVRIVHTNEAVLKHNASESASPFFGSLSRGFRDERIPVKKSIPLTIIHQYAYFFGGPFVYIFVRGVGDIPTIVQNCTSGFVDLTNVKSLLVVT